MKYNNIQEEELKNKVGADLFADFDTTQRPGKIDFTVVRREQNLFGGTHLLWAEAKTGDYDVVTMFVQLILTIGRARTFDRILPPPYLGALDFKKIVFVPYNCIQDIFYLNDFNWNITPSDHHTKEFQLIKERIKDVIGVHKCVFDYEQDEEVLSRFIKKSLAKATSTKKIQIDKNNFIPLYLRWREHIMPIIDVDWESVKKKRNILDSDFYLADLFVEDNDTESISDDQTIRDGLFVSFSNQCYKISRDDLHQEFDATVNITNKELYKQFWKSYKRPPKDEIQQYIIDRRDLLVPQDIRETKGAFFTPRRWVELSQKYLCDVLGENWQEEYYVWDCAAGTGNLLVGLTNKYNIYASTLDQADVNVMQERIKEGANLLPSHVFQFDFLNDDFTKLPQSLQDIIGDEEKRKRLVIYINPPYAEGDNVRGTGRKNVHVSKIHTSYKEKLGKASSEVFALFFARIAAEIAGSVLAEFSKLKILQAPNFSVFRNFFQAKLNNAFIVPANTFDNVRGDFPIGFFIWDTSQEDTLENVVVDVYDAKGTFDSRKRLSSYDGEAYVSKWLENNSLKANSRSIGHLASVGNDFQNQRMLFVDNKDKTDWKKGGRHTIITSDNLLVVAIYFAVRKVIPATWLNDRDQFLYPNENWATDKEFQSDCLVYLLFNTNISSGYGTNHWIPFTEAEVNAQEKFESNFMVDFISGKTKRGEEATVQSLFERSVLIDESREMEFSLEAKGVLDAGRELWRYYHSKEGVNVNASLYDIKEYFQGRNEKGKMNNRSSDEKYNEMIGLLRSKLNVLAQKITPKVYEYGFLERE